MNIQTVMTDATIFALLYQVMNDITVVINHENRMNITGVRAHELVSYTDSKLLYCAHVKSGYVCMQPTYIYIG